MNPDRSEALVLIPAWNEVPSVGDMVAGVRSHGYDVTEVPVAFRVREQSQSSAPPLAAIDRSRSWGNRAA